jgi:hypothetical protein
LRDIWRGASGFLGTVVAAKAKNNARILKRFLQATDKILDGFSEFLRLNDPANPE